MRRQRRGGERGRRDAEAGDDVDLVVDDQLLRDPLGVVRDGAVVLEDDLDLLAGDGVALLLHIELDRVVDLLAGRGLAAGHRQDQADLESILGIRRRGEQRSQTERAGDRGAAGQCRCGHFSPPLNFLVGPPGAALHLFS